MRTSVETIGLFLAICLAIFPCAPSASAKPLPKRPFFSHLALPPGFVPTSRMPIAQDEEGFLWLGTADGLYRFDGHRMNRIERSSGCSRVNHLHASGPHLWLGTRCGLERMHLETEDVESWPLESPDGPAPTVHQVILDPDGWLWVGSNQGLRWLDPEGRWRDRVPASELPSALEQQSIRVLYTEEDLLWIGTSAGLFYYDTTTQVMGQIPFAETYDDPKHLWIEAIHRDIAGTLWVTTADGLRKLQGRTSTHSGSLVLEQDLPRRCNNSVRQWYYGMATDLRGTFWISSGGSLIGWHPETDLLECHSRYNKDPFGLGGSAGTLFVDRSGALWVATERTLDRHRPPLFTAWNYAFDDVVTEFGWRAAWSASPVLDAAGDLWVGSNLGLLQIDAAGHRLKRHFMADEARLLELVGRSTVGGLPDFTVLAVALENDGTLWVGTAEGLARRSPDAPGFEPIPVVGFENPSPRITKLLTTAEGLWVGTNEALYFRQRENGRWIQARIPPGPDHDKPFEVFDLAQGPLGEIWVGTLNHGLRVIEPGSDEMSTPHLVSEPRSSLERGHVNHLYFESEERLWVAFRDSSLLEIDLATREARDAPWAHRLGDRYLRQILRLGDHYWLLSQLGLSRWTPATDEIHHFTVQDGLLEPRSIFGLLASREGRLLLSGTSLFEFDPAQEAMEIPPVQLTNLLLFNQPVSARDDSPLEASLAQTDRLELDHRHAVVTFEFSALGAARPEELRYFYLLEGSDQRWIEARRGHPFATYNHLVPGTYRLRLRAGGRDTPVPGQPNTERSLVVVVKPPWWRSPLAWLSYVLLGLALVGTLLRVQRQKLTHERQVNDRLRQLDGLKDEFLANTSHELRTPLFGLTGVAESLLEDTREKVSPKVRRSLDLIVSSGRRLSALVQDMQDFSALRREGIELEPRPLALAPLAEGVLASHRPLLVDKALTLSHQLPTDLPAFEADESRVQQILHHLVDNAIKFSDRGEVVILAAPQEDRLRIEVRDEGTGIPEENQASIFNFFEQVDGTLTRSHGGTGLGLAISRHLVELHGGQLGVESTLGKGSTFFFDLPLTEKKPANTLPLEETRPVVHPRTLELSTEASLSQPTWGESSPKILMVDDEPVNLLVLETYLDQENYRLTTASDGPSALERIAQEDFDLVLLDVMMPKMSGFEVCRRIREHHPIETLPILFLTARTEIADRVEGLQQGANDYLIKPVAREELLARVAKELGIAQKSRQAQEEIGELRRLLPICSSCHKIRDDEGIWEEMERYLEKHAAVRFTHSLCADCAAKFLSEAKGPSAD